jgi:hypothetical protein
VVLNAGDAQTLTVSAAATTNYNAATKTVTIDVAKANQTITWSNPTGITFGTALSSTQLNATTTGDGVLTYTPAAGTRLNAGDGQTLSVTAAATTNYNAATQTVAINVAKATPTVTWTNPADIAYGAALGADQLNATASVPGTFTYSPAAGTKLNAGNGQTLSVTFTPTDAANYASATKTATINVAKADQTISWTAPAAIGYGTALSATQLNATTTGDGALSYNPASGAVLNADTHTLLERRRRADVQPGGGRGTQRWREPDADGHGGGDDELQRGHEVGHYQRGEGHADGHVGEPGRHRLRHGAFGHAAERDGERAGQLRVRPDGGHGAERGQRPDALGDVHAD